MRNFSLLMFFGLVFSWSCFALAGQDGNGVDPVLVEKATMAQEIKMRLFSRVRAFNSVFEPEHFTGASVKIFKRLKENSEELFKAPYKIIDSSESVNACLDDKGKKVPLSSHIGNVNEGICFDLELLVNGPKSTSLSMLVGMTFHEYVHIMGEQDSIDLNIFTADVAELYRQRNDRLRLVYYTSYPEKDNGVRISGGGIISWENVCINRSATGGRIRAYFSGMKGGLFSSAGPFIVKLGENEREPSSFERKDWIWEIPMETVRFAFGHHSKKYIPIGVVVYNDLTGEQIYENSKWVNGTYFSPDCFSQVEKSFEIARSVWGK